MCVLVRCTVRRTAPALLMRIRVCRARRSLDWFLALMVAFLCLLLLRFFEDDDLVGIPHALALVGLGRAVGAHFGGHLSHELLVDAAQDDLRLRRRRDL